MIRYWLLAAGLVLELTTAASAQQILRVPQDVGNLQQAINQVGNGGIIELTDLTVEGSSILRSDAASGGGLSAIHESLAKLTGVTFAGNTAQQSGGALTAAPSLLPDPPSGANAATVASSFVGFAWSGRTARLDGEPLSASVGLREVTRAGTFELEVGSATVGTAQVRSGRGFFLSRRYPDFRFKVRILANGQTIFGTPEPACIDETVCVSGALAGRSELFLRLIGPRPNGFLHTQLVRFTPSRVDVEIERAATGERQVYVLPEIPRSSHDLGGRVDREAFVP